jgi:hypothetical protein
MSVGVQWSYCRTSIGRGRGVRRGGGEIHLEGLPGHLYRFEEKLEEKENV